MQDGPAPCDRGDSGLRFVGRARPVRRAFSLPTTAFPSRVARGCVRAVPNSHRRLLAAGSLSRSLAERGIQPFGGSLSLAVPVSLSNHHPRGSLRRRRRHTTRRSDPNNRNLCPAGLSFAGRRARHASRHPSPSARFVHAWTSGHRILTTRHAVRKAQRCRKRPARSRRPRRTRSDRARGSGSHLRRAQPRVSGDTPEEKPQFLHGVLR